MTPPLPPPPPPPRPPSAVPCRGPLPSEPDVPATPLVGRGVGPGKGPASGMKKSSRCSTAAASPWVLSSLFALIEEGSCFVGTYLELALACDRSYHLALPNDETATPKIAVSDTNFGTYPMITGQSRLQRRFYGEASAIEAVRAQTGTLLDADAAFALGLVTANPDDIDWTDEVRIAIEERVSMSPDAMTGLEANLRFNGPENMFTRIFGRLTAWQNWIFQRPNAVGEYGALKVYGKGVKSVFDWNRV